jgi:hypothetical protein
MGLKRRRRSDKYEDIGQICHVAAVSVNITTPTAIFVATGLSCRIEELAGLRSERETRVTEPISNLQDPQHKTKKTGAEVSAIRFYSAIAARR